jgi:N-methylhydantoinase B
MERDPGQVLEDVRNGYVSAAAAVAKYGVVIAGGEIDEAETARQRS